MIAVGTDAGNVAEAAMSLIHLPESVEGRPTSVTIAVVGLLGAPRARALADAGCAVSLEPTIVFARLDVSDLLVLAPGQPEPAAWMLTRHLRERSAIPVLALVPAPTDVDRGLLLDAGADGCLDAASSDDELVIAVDALLARRSKTPRTGAGIPSRMVLRERLPA
jgi:DNA-binding response OmpR family regulator